jgi:hypothetical protein
VILDNAASRTTWRCASPCLLQSLHPSCRSTVPVAMLHRRDATRSGAANHKPARRGEAGRMRNGDRPSQNVLSRPTDITPPLPISIPESRWTRWGLPGPLSSPRVPAWGLGSTGVRCKVFPRLHRARLFPCLACVFESTSVHVSHSGLTSQPICRVQPSCGMVVSDTQTSGFYQTDRLCIVSISCPCEDTDTTLASDSQEGGP